MLSFEIRFHSDAPHAALKLVDFGLELKVRLRDTRTDISCSGPGVLHNHSFCVVGDFNSNLACVCPRLLSRAPRKRVSRRVVVCSCCVGDACGLVFCCPFGAQSWHVDLRRSCSSLWRSRRRESFLQNLIAKLSFTISAIVCLCVWIPVYDLGTSGNAHTTASRHYMTRV